MRWSRKGRKVGGRACLLEHAARAPPRHAMRRAVDGRHMYISELEPVGTLPATPSLLVDPQARTASPHH